MDWLKFIPNILNRVGKLENSSVDLSGYQQTSQKDQVNGYAGLNASSLIDFIKLDQDTKAFERVIDTNFSDLDISNNTTTIKSISGFNSFISYKTTNQQGNLNMFLGNVGEFTALYVNGITALPTSSSRVMWLQFGFSLPTLSNSTNRYILRVGLDSNNIVASNPNRIALVYSDDINSGNFQLITSDNSVVTTLNTNITATKNVNYDIKIKITNTSVTFYINDVEQTAITTTIPYTRLVRPSIGTVKSIGGNTIASAYFNYMKAYYIGNRY